MGCRIAPVGKLAVKLATWNLRRPSPNSPARCAAITDWITRVNADVWVLTETDDSISPGPEFSSVSTAATDRPGRPSERWTTIWCRWPIERLAETSDPARAVAARIQPPIGPPLVVYGTVLPWLGSPWQDHPSARGLAFSAALAAQRSDWDELRQKFPEADLCVLGDLNQDLSRRHYYGSALGHRALRAALSSVALTPLTADPNDPVRSLDPIRASIDHICVPATSTRMTNPLLQAWPPNAAMLRGLSDHFGSAATFA